MRCSTKGYKTSPKKGCCRSGGQSSHKVVSVGLLFYFSAITWSSNRDKDAPHIRQAMVVAHYTGGRPGPKELFSLKWSDVDFFNETFMITGAEKGGLDSREIPIAAKFMTLLKEWRREDEKAEKNIYLIQYHGVKVQSIKTGWKAAMRRAGVTRRVRRYDLRHMMASELLAQGVSVKVVADILGHKDPVQTMRTYQHVRTPLKKSAVDCL